jgi:subtilase family serine protease
MLSYVGIRSCFAGILILGVGCAAGISQTPVNRILGPIDEAQVVTLRGNVHPLARGEFDQGVVDAETELGPMVLELVASKAQQGALDALVEAQHDAGSGLYRQWLTPAGYGARFGAGAQDVERIAAWLKGHGFTVEKIPESNRLILFSGTAGQVSETFHTEIHHYLVDGVEHIANAQDEQIPEALAGVVGGVVSLHDFRRTSEMSARKLLESRTAAGAGALYTAGSTHYLFPADWATIYDLNSLYSAGTTGTGISIAIVGRSNITLSDVTGFRATADLVANNPAVILVGANPGLVSGDQDEATLDVEWSGAVAPAAAVKLVVGASAGFTDGVDLSAAYIVNHATAPVVSTSYGSCEQDMGASELAFYNDLWEQAASQGMSSFVASGDAGASGCSSGSSASGSGTAVNGLCSSPYATCVGGTEFNEGAQGAQYWAATNSTDYGSALSYIPEEVWNESGLNGGSGLWASGGGASSIYAEPSWQKGVSGTSAANGMRAVPDMAMSAAGHDGYVIEEKGSFWVISGTSAATPSFAGLMALVVEKQGGKGVGNANPELYSLLSAEHNPFHATPSGNNSVAGVPGYVASGAEYNLATGLGSVDGALLVSGWGAGSATGTDFVLTASAASGTVQVGATATFTVSAAASGSASPLNGITLAAKGQTGVTVAVQPGSITTGATATVTITVGSTAADGAQNITLTGEDASGTQTLTYALTVTPASATADFTINVASGTSGSTTVQSGGTAAETYTISPANGAGAFPNAIALSVTGLPSGATAVFSPASVAAGLGINTVTLTIQLPQASAAAQPIGAGDSPSRLAARLAPLSMAVLLLPFAAGLRRGRQRLGLGRLMRLGLLVLVGMGAITGLSGCKLNSSVGQTAQTYTVIVTGTSGTLSHSSTVTLTVK